MASILAGIDYSEATKALVQALAALRKRLRATVYLYHAYQLPRGFPFLSAGVIEKIEAEAEVEANAKLKAFLSDILPARERRGMRLIVQREFVSEGIRQHLKAARYDILAIGATSDESEEGVLGFHARHFIRKATIPVLLTFPESLITWRRVLIVYDSQFPLASRTGTRRLLKRLNIPVIGLPVTRLTILEKQHKSLQRLVAPLPYEPFLWRGLALIEILMHAAAFYEADVIAIMSNAEDIIKGMQELPAQNLRGGPAWLFFPEKVDKEAEDLDSSE